MFLRVCGTYHFFPPLQNIYMHLIRFRVKRNQTKEKKTTNQPTNQPNMSGRKSRHYRDESDSLLNIYSTQIEATTSLPSYGNPVSNINISPTKFLTRANSDISAFSGLSFVDDDNNNNNNYGEGDEEKQQQQQQRQALSQKEEKTQSQSLQGSSGLVHPSESCTSSLSNVRQRLPTGVPVLFVEFLLDTGGGLSQKTRRSRSDLSQFCRAFVYGVIGVLSARVAKQNLLRSVHGFSEELGQGLQGLSRGGTIYYRLYLSNTNSQSKGVEKRSLLPNYIAIESDHGRALVEFHRTRKMGRGIL